MKRWGIAVFCGAGILIGLAATNATESSGKRLAVASRHVTSTDGINRARYGGLRQHKARHLNARVGGLHRAKASARADKARGMHRTAKAQSSRLRVFQAGRPVPQRSAIYRVGKPYVIGGRTYTPRMDPNYRAEGKASWYGGNFHGRITASGEKFDARALTAAHPTLPLLSYVRVTNLQNQRSLVVRVNDRGPFRGNRLIDVSVRAATLLGFYDQGVARVRVEYVGRAKLAETPRQDRSPGLQAATETRIRPGTSNQR